MTISDWFFPAYSGGGSLNATPGSPALNIGRNFTPFRSTIYDPAGFPVATPTPIRPMAIDNPLSADQWGVSFPAGTIGVTNVVARQTPAAGPFSSDWAAFWTYRAQNQTGAGGSGGTPNIILVPSTLPGSYTARLKRDWHSGTNGAQLQQESSSYQLRTANGYSLYKWIPDNRINGFLSTGLSSSGLFPGIASAIYTEGVGSRKVQYDLFILCHGLPPFFDGAFKVTGSHNADGSFLNLFTIGTTVDWVHTYTFAQLTATGTFIGGDPLYHTGFIDAGSALATNGNWTQNFCIQIDNAGTSPHDTFDSYGPNSMPVRVSPRVDVPLPFTITGVGDLIVVGGTL